MEDLFPDLMAECQIINEMNIGSPYLTRDSPELIYGRRKNSIKMKRKTKIKIKCKNNKITFNKQTQQLLQ